MRGYLVLATLALTTFAMAQPADGPEVFELASTYPDSNPHNLRDTPAGSMLVGREDDSIVIHYLDSGRREVVAADAAREEEDGWVYPSSWQVAWADEVVAVWREIKDLADSRQEVLRSATWDGAWTYENVHTFNAEHVVEGSTSPAMARLSGLEARGDRLAMALTEPRSPGDAQGHVVWLEWDGSWSKEVIHEMAQDEGPRYGVVQPVIDDDGGRHVVLTIEDRSTNPATNEVRHFYDAGTGWVEGVIPGAARNSPRSGEPSMGGALVTLPVGTPERELRLAHFDGASWSLGTTLASGESLTPDGRLTISEDDAGMLIGASDGYYLTTASSGWSWSWSIDPPGFHMAWLDQGILAISQRFETWGDPSKVTGFNVGGVPHARFSVDQHEVTTRTSIQLQDDSILPEGRTAASWTWTWPGGTASGESVQATIEEPGRHSIRLHVTDSTGASDTGAGPVDVTQIGPDACMTAPSTGKTGEAVSFQSCSSHPESDLGATLASFAWDFGDGATSPQVSTSHSYASPGTYTVTLTVTDEQGATDAVTQSITITDLPPNQEPEVDFSYAPASPLAGQEVTFSATATDSDGSIASTAWTVDGIDAGSGTSLTRAFAEAGSVSVTFTATDDQGASTSVTKHVSVQVPQAPDLSVSQTQLFDTAGQELGVTVTVENPNPVPITVELASDAPDAWNAAFSTAVLEVDAMASQQIPFTFTPPYFQGGLTVVEIRATLGEEEETALLRVQLQPGQAPDAQETEDPASSDDPTDEDGSEPASVQQSNGPDSSIPTWAWFAGGGAVVVLAGLGAGTVILMRRP